MTVLVLPPALRARIESEARAAFPCECCGLIEGVRRDGRVEAAVLHPAPNLAAEPDRFEIDPIAHLHAQRAARANGRTIVGCYHSHPHGRAEPSARDAAGAMEIDFVWLIAAIAPPAAPVLAAFVHDPAGFSALEIASGLA